MGKLFYFKFVPSDWMNCPELRGVSSAARGLWMDMLCLMFQCDRRGYLQLNNGKILTAESLARLTGSSTEDVSRWLQELENSDVFSRTEEGCIYSRRQVREQTERSRANDRMQKFRENGGGDPTRWLVIRARILVRDNYSCGYCNHRATSVDHIVPRSKGGGESDENLIACCKPCNQLKGNRTPKEAGMAFWRDAIVTHSVTPISNYNSNSYDFDVGSKENNESSDVLIERIVMLHPANWREKGHIAQVPHAQAIAIIAAISRDGPDLVEQGTGNYAAAVRKWPVSEQKFATNPVRFWADSHYLRDPQVWERENGKPSKTEERVSRNRKAILDGLGIGQQLGSDQPDLQDRTASGRGKSLAKFAG